MTGSASDNAKSTPETYEKPYEILVIENNAFKARIKDLEQKLANSQKTIRTESQTRLFQLIKEKDKALEDNTARLDIKINELEESLVELREKNQDAQNAAKSLSIYQLMFEGHPDAIIGFDSQSQLIQFNSAAVTLFGMELHGLRLNHASKVKLPGSGLDFEQIVLQAYASAEPIFKEFACGESFFIICSYRMVDLQKIRGVAVQIYPKR